MEVKPSQFVVTTPPSARFYLHDVWALLLSFLILTAFSQTAPATTIDGVTTNTSAFTFPASGSGSTLWILNGGVLNNTGTGTIGTGVGDNNNSVIITNTGSAWLNTGEFDAGNFGAGNSLIIAAGALVSNAVAHIGQNRGSNSARVTGANSTWKNAGNLYIGYNSGGSNNSLMIDGGATVSVVGEGWVGGNGNGNTATVTGTGSVWNCTGNFWVGSGLGGGGFSGGNNNKLVIANGGQVNNAQAGVGTWWVTGNSVVVSNAGSVWNNNAELYVGGFHGANNSLLVADGGTVIATTLYLNSDGANNSVILSNGTIRANNITPGSSAYSIVSFGGQFGARSGDATYSANMTLTNDGSGNATTILAADTNGVTRNVTMSGILSGNGLLVKAGAGTLTLNNANTFTGGTTVSNGTLKLGVAGAIASQTALRVEGGLVDMNSQALTVSALSGNGGAVSNGSLTVNQSTLTTFAGIIAGAVTLTKSGAGTLTLSGSNTFTGGTTVSNGTLLINGTAGSGAVQVKTGATLGGTGTISGAVTIDAGGTLSASAGGSLTLAQAPVLNGSATIGNGLTLNVGTAWSESTTVALQGGTLAGGNLTNLIGGNLQGWGEVRAALINQGSVTATNSELRLNTFSGGGSYQAVGGGTLTFTTSGTVGFLANTNGTVRLGTGVTLTNNTAFNNAGTLALAGGTYQTTTRLTNGVSGWVTGYGTLNSAATLVNSGTIQASGGIANPLFITSALTNAGWVTASAGGLDVTGMFTNSGTLNMVNSRGTFHSTVVNTGAWITDPSTNVFENSVTVTSTGYINASTGDVYVFHGNLMNQSTRSNNWQTLNTAPGSGADNGTRFEFDGAGLTLTQRFNTVGQLLTGGFIDSPAPTSNGVQHVSAFANVTGFDNNFALAQLVLTNTTLLVAQATPSPTINALFVNDLFLSADAHLVVSNNMRLYFVNSNSWDLAQVTLLGSAQLHQLAAGLPLAVPEPNVLLMWLAGLATLYVARRRRQRQ